MKNWRTRPGMGPTEELLVEEYVDGAELPAEAVELGAQKRDTLMLVGTLPHPTAVYELEPGGVITIKGGQVGWQPPTSERGPDKVTMTWREVLERRYEEVPD